MVVCTNHFFRAIQVVGGDKRLPSPLCCAFLLFPDQAASPLAFHLVCHVSKDTLAARSIASDQSILLGGSSSQEEIHHGKLVLWSWWRGHHTKMLNPKGPWKSTWLWWVHCVVWCDWCGWFLGSRHGLHLVSWAHAMLSWAVLPCKSKKNGSQGWGAFSSCWMDKWPAQRTCVSHGNMK